jgi:UDP-N-acetylmuramoyl-L-alanyl-D-glutamate--2,6-diaminopimelate ligase
MNQSGVEYVVLEVSSQALYTHRVDGIKMDTVVFTNLGHDHIGKFEHPDHDHYIKSKSHLFDDEFDAELCVRNEDDTMTERVTKHFSKKALGYSMKGNGAVNANNIKYYQGKNSIGVMFDISTEGNTYSAMIPMAGDFNVQNALCAFSVCSKYISEPEKIIKALATVKIDGRFEIYYAPNGAVFVIDYAHNGLSLSCALEELRKFCNGRLICLFGSVGGRTQNRREELGRAAGFYSDYCIVTSDNPNFEDPMNVINDILYHVKLEKCKWSAIADRKSAIEFAYHMAKEGDVVLLAGKGHESYQLINGIKVPFSERIILSKLIENDKKAIAAENLKARK